MARLGEAEMSFDYRTPRKPNIPKAWIGDGGVPFARFDVWSAQTMKNGKWLSVGRRVSWSAIFEFVQGFSAATWLARAESYYKGPSVVWIVGPDGNGYECIQCAGDSSDKEVNDAETSSGAE